MSGKRHFFQSGATYVPNTFIGGAGATTIASASALASKLSISESQIKAFTVDGSNNVSCYIGVNYSILSGWTNDDNVTYYIDAEGHCTDMSNFGNGFDNLLYVYFPNASYKADFSLQSDNSLKANLDSISQLNNRGLLDTSNIKKCYLPSVISESLDTNGCLKNMSECERVYLRSLSFISTGTRNASMYRNTGRGWLLMGLNSTCKVYYHANLGIANRNSFAIFDGGVWAVGDTITINGLLYTGVSSAPSTDGEFQITGANNTDWANFRTAINSDTRTGTYSNITAIGDNSSTAIYVDAVGATGDTVTLSLGVGNTGTVGISYGFRGGNDIHPTLIYLRDLGCTLVELTSIISVNAPSGLGYTNLTSSSVDLEFTPGTPNANGVECYEVWVNDGTVYRKWFVYDEIGASGDTLDLSDVVADVGSLSGVAIKIREMDTQMNFSDFSNEIILP